MKPRSIIADFANLLALAVIVLVFLFLLSVLAQVFLPRDWLTSSYLAEFCIGERFVQGERGPVLWLRGVWLAVPPRQAAELRAFNAPGTLCGILPWIGGEAGFWYRAVQP
ncbi:MAG: hypothetical protein DDG60_15100 [Anaerolineae bacterium]|nr:MAG: hypothetical protein DDG60_15100 [Anaerolineae bacterium]